MGISYSKLFRELSSEKASEERQQTDPRSPSLHISRTPMSVLQKQSHSKITKAQDLTTDIQTPLSGSYEALFPRTTQLEQLHVQTNSMDPRSPSQGVQRTPLTLPPELEEVVPVTLLESEQEEDSASESFESALSKIDFESFDEEKKPLETNFDYRPPESAPVENAIDPRSPGIDRTPFVFQDDVDKNECEDATPKSVLNVFQDENAGQNFTPKLSIVGQEGARTPLSCLANRGAPRTAESNAKTVRKGMNNLDNRPLSVFTSAKGNRGNSKIPLPKRCIEN
ncbi:uncharacterized protein LOC132262248 [Phlebotomus argentipes]|uniref:uncharacterized protein LOC132262248 n=1 Tax=Phlebotomus argentipes TaxID=94469 RepID=UPI002892B506|nr:uncharacterized protein LOC132262248 [Phlebotomus argentipes]